MSKFMNVYEGIGTKIISKATYALRGGQNKTFDTEAEARDSFTKIVFISEANYNDKSNTQLLRAWNPDDFNHFGMFYGVYKQFSGTKLIAPKKQLIVSKAFWEAHANDKILVFSVQRSDCKKGRDLIAQPVTTFMYTVSKDKLKTKKMALPLRQFIRKCGYKAVASKVDGEELK